MHPSVGDDDGEDVVYESVRLGRRRAWILPIVLAASVLVVGFAGAHIPGDATRLPAPSEAQAAATATPLRGFFGGPLTVSRPNLLLPGFMQLNPGDHAIQVDLPAGISSPSLATQARTLFYIRGGLHIESIRLAAQAAPRTLVDIPLCHEIDQLALAGNSVLYVVISPIGLPLHDTDCGSSSRFGWAIYRYDLATGAQTQLANGTTDVPASWDSAPIVHLAASPTAFAFEREPASGRGPVPVEVHSLDGKLMWTTTASNHVHELMLSGERLAAVTADGLAVADPATHAMRTIAPSEGDAALSPDGRYLVWQGLNLDGLDPSRSNVTLLDFVTGRRTILASGPGAVAEGAAPAVGFSQMGPEIAWSAQLADGNLAPAFVDPVHPGGAMIESPQLLAWLAFSGDDLVWVTGNPDGTARAFVVDLPTAQAAAP